jgi:hypothetical protein
VSIVPALKTRASTASWEGAVEGTECIRWIVQRTFAWLLRNQRLVVDYERKVLTSETLIEVAMIRLLVTRLGQRA